MARAFWIRIYSVGVWNKGEIDEQDQSAKLEFTPLEFETAVSLYAWLVLFELEFTPLEFETKEKLMNKINLQN